MIDSSSGRIGHLQKRIIETLAVRKKLAKTLSKDLSILKQLSHISQLRREDAAKAKLNAYETDETKKMKENLSDVLHRIETLSEVVVDNKKSKEKFVQMMSEEMHEMARSLTPESLRSGSISSMSLSSLISSRLGTPVEGAKRNVVWSPHRIDSMSSVLQRARVASQLRQEQIGDVEEKRIFDMWSKIKNSSSSSSSSLPGFLGSVDQTIRRRRRSQLLAAAKSLAVGSSKMETTTTRQAPPPPPPPPASKSMTAQVASQRRKYSTAQVLASGGALRCVECHSGSKALQTDLDEDGQPYLFCESCWGDFYKERFDGTRLSSPGILLSTNTLQELLRAQ